MKTYYGFIASALCAAALLASCKEEESKTEVKAEATPLVGVVAATTEVVVDDQAYSSTVQAWAKNNIAPQQGGRIEKLLVEVGDFVKEGQIVARMEDVQLQQSELQIKNDEVELARIKSLYEKGGLSQSDFEAFEMACKVHKSTYENLLRNTILRSPITGVISARNYDEGDLYGMAQPLYTVEQIVPVKLLIAVSESDYSRIKKGAKANVTTDAFPELVFTGEITNIFPTVDAATHTFTAEVTVKNPYKTLRPGMYAKVTVTFGQTTRVIVPDVAVVKQTGSGDRFVYVLNADNTVDYRKVDVGRRVGDRYVILSGLAEGEKVVNEGLLRLKNGIKVNVAE